MKIKLLSQEIELIKVDENASVLKTNCDGLSRLYENKIYFDTGMPFPVLIHEIMHFFLFLTGNENREDYTEEQICCLISRMVYQLMLENGDGIIKQIKEFANKN